MVTNIPVKTTSGGQFNPFARLERGREVFAWGMYDLANQSFQLLIKTLLFSLYVTNVVSETVEKGDAMWTAMSASSMLMVALLSPILGSIADRRAWRREMLLVSGVICSVFTFLLTFVGPGDTALCVGLYVVAALACGLGETFLGAFLPEISTEKNIGYVSAVGWTMSYLGALLLLIITSVYAFVLGYRSPEDFRPMFAFSGLWFLAGMLPAWLWLQERTPPSVEDSGTGVHAALRHLRDSFQDALRYRQLMRFFLTFFVYNLGTLAVINFLSIIGREMGFDLGHLLLFALVMAVSAGVASATTARFQDRLGHKHTVMSFLAFWVLAMLGIAGTQYYGAPGWTFWVISAITGLALGGIGTSTRAMVGAFTPAHRSAEFFGVWGMISQASGILGVIAFGVVKQMAATQVPAVLMLAGFFGFGLILMLRIDPAEGVRTAREAEIQKGVPDIPLG